ncbi:MAG TPA: DUF2202 domain-containing protein [Prolixibacteraceae bacterium]|nr:DUF2202 domain-containing protein [Prolixibacteraceae bacterium]
MKTRNRLFGMVLLASSIITFSSCSDSPVAPADDLSLKSATTSLPTVFPELISGEETGILQMREEEKMAHDVYVNFYSLWNLPVFETISTAETNHYNAVYTLITAYGLADPSTGVDGTFTNTAIAELYAQLIDKGSVSLEEALKAGAYIEEYDILDLEKLLAETDNSAVIQIYSNLLRGSRNHLRAFVSTLATYQIIYTPEIMDQDSFDVLVNSPMETGTQNGLKNGNGNQNGKGNGNGKSGNGNSGNGNSSSKGTGTGTGVCVNG